MFGQLYFIVCVSRLLKDSEAWISVAAQQQTKSAHTSAALDTAGGF